MTKLLRSKGFSNKDGERTPGHHTFVRLKGYLRWIFWWPRRWWAVLISTLVPLILLWQLATCGKEQAAAQWFKYLEGALQVLGGTLILIGLLESQARFRVPGPVGWVKRWWSVRPWKPKVISGIAASSAAAAVGRGVLSGWFNAPPVPSIYQRLSVLEKNLDRLRAQVQASDSERRREIDELENSLRKEVEALKQADHQHSEKFREHAVGSLDDAYLGLAWLIASAVVSMFERELPLWICRVPVLNP